MRNILKVYVSVIFLLMACNGSFFLGKEFISEEESLKTFLTDTFTITLQTKLSYPILTTGGNSVMFPSNYAPFLFIGNLEDPIFGKTYASFMAEIRQVEYPFFGDTAVVDSVYFILPLTLNDNFYGQDTTIPINISVYRLTDTLNHYLYNTQNPELYYTEDEWLGTANAKKIIYKASKEGQNDTVVLAVKLNNAIGQELVQNEHDYFESTGGLFHRKFFGVYVKVNNVNNAIYRINITNQINYEKSGLVIYYHYPSGKNYNYVIPITENSARTNIFKHDFSSSPINEQVSDTTVVWEKVYLKGFGGTIVKINLDNIVKLKNVVINKAELVINVDKQYASQRKPSPKLWLIGLDSANNFIRFKDFYGTMDYSGASYINGQYRFSITRIIQSIIDDRYNYSEYGLYLVDLDAHKNGNHTVIYNKNSQITPSKLYIIYTKK